MDNLIDKRIFKAYAQAFMGILIFLGLNQVMARYLMTHYAIDPIVYTCTAFISCALILLTYSGYGPLTKETIRNVDTWIYGIILILGYIIGCLLLYYITATEGTVLQKLSILFGIIINYALLLRKPDKYQLIGTSIILCGVFLTFYDLKFENKGIVILLALVYGFLQSIRLVSAELHRPHKKIKTETAKDKARVVGLVMLSISSLVLFGYIFVAFINHLYPITQFPAKMIPNFTALFDPITIFTGFLVGIILVAPLRFIEFSSTQIINSENFLAISAFAGVSTISWEFILSDKVDLDISTISILNIYSVILVTLGALVIALSRKFVNKNADLENYIFKDVHNIDAVEDSKEIVMHSLEHFKGDILRVAVALDIPLNVLEKILKDNKKLYAFRPHILKIVGRRYRKNISNCDALTGILNRTGFIAEAKELMGEYNQLSLFFLDLNKFKPVNDTYGHEAGDAVLQIIAKRLEKEFIDGLVGRFGGDEFCIMLKHSKQEALKQVIYIQNLVSEPINYEGSHVSVGTSVGVASYIEDSEDIMELIKLADKQMYTDKSDR